ncbi:MAG: YegS/Rv2252/BmrU family lipid kinase [Lachnospiraceae bacterium]|nr:YegS/Rv2252/BmrU family lipid kinase [Lachnospiraceae bacterium]
MDNTSKKMVFVYNQFAGRERIKVGLADIIYSFSEAGYEVSACPTLGKGDAERLARECPSDCSLLVCSGGDGTLSEVVNGVLKREEGPLAIGYIPAGSTNDFSVSLGIPADIKSAAEVVLNGKEFACDIGRFNDRYFCYAAAFGLFTDVSYDTEQVLKNFLGHAAYILEAMKRLTDIKSYDVEIEHDGEIIKDSFIFGLICNSESVGGFKGITGNSVELNDGLFEVILVKMPQFDTELSEIVSVLTSGDIIGNSKNIIRFKTSGLKVRSTASMPWTIDGEYGGDPVEAEIRILPEAVRFIVPRDEIDDAK